MNVGIIGFGRLGKLITGYLAQDYPVLVYDILDKKDEIKSAGAKAATFEEVCKQDFVIPFVPMSEFEETIKKMAPLLNENATVIDGCSVKEMPVNVMKKHLPKSIQIMGTHPMFGPDSAKDTLFGTKIVVCNVRMQEKMYSNILHYLTTNGIRVIESTPEEHDKDISSSLVLTHFIGRGLIEFGAESLLIDTKGYRRLMKILETVENDTWQLFEDMNKYNRFSKDARSGFIKSLQDISDKVKDE